MQNPAFGSLSLESIISRTTPYGIQSGIYARIYMKTYYGFVGAIHTARRDWDCLLRSQNTLCHKPVRLWGIGGAGLLSAGFARRTSPIARLRGCVTACFACGPIPLCHISLEGPRHPRAQTIPQWKPTLILDLDAVLQA